MESIKVSFTIKNEALTAVAYVEFCKRIINNLLLFNNIFSSIETWDNKNKVDYVFSKDLSDFNENNLKMIINEDEEVAYTNINGTDKNLNKDSKSWCGFNSSFNFRNNTISLNISHGSTEDESSFMDFEFNENLKIDKHFVTSLIEEISSLVTVKFANCITNKFFLKVRQRGKKSIGWINYFSDKRVFALLPDNVDKKQLQNGGCIFWLSEGKPLSTDENMVQKAIKIRETLDANNIQ